MNEIMDFRGFKEEDQEEEEKKGDWLIKKEIYLY